MDYVQEFNESAERRKQAYGVDKDPEKRPGVPMELEPHKVPGLHWDEPERQELRNEKLKRAALDELTPVFGTAVPPRGLSGALRRYAYKIPEHKVSHWAILMASDRIDVLEGKAIEHPRRAVGIVAVGLGFLMWARKR